MEHRQAAARILLLLFITAVLSFSGCSGQQKQEDLKVQAWNFVVRSVTAKLENPKNLAFPPDSASNVTPLGDNRFQITSFANFTNEKGQQEHAYFHGIVVYGNKTWTLESLKFAE